MLDVREKGAVIIGFEFICKVRARRRRRHKRSICTRHAYRFVEHSDVNKARAFRTEIPWYIYCLTIYDFKAGCGEGEAWIGDGG